MLSAIKTKIILVLGGILAIAGVAIKILLWRNKIKDEKINNLEQNAEVIGKVHEASIKRVKFNTKQEQKIQSVNDESNLDKLERGTPVEKNEDDLWNSITR